jgi:hypothetical protein
MGAADCFHLQDFVQKVDVAAIGYVSFFQLSRLLASGIIMCYAISVALPLYLKYKHTQEVKDKQSTLWSYINPIRFDN